MSQEPTSGPDGDSPQICNVCGGPIEGHWEDDSDEYTTPLSLALTPEETPPWFDPEQDRADLGTLRIPEQIGRYQLRESLGGGGFGQVFRAYDPRLDRDVALKVLRESQPSARVMERFFREARAAAQLDHPHIVSLHDAGRDEGRCWIAYQFVEGRTLSRVHAESGAMEPGMATRVVRDLASALDHAHRRGVLHRDVKPANVILEPGGRARLTDFGLARRLDLDATMTVEGTILGTPAYMSPEQASGRSHAADARSDVYSLGVMYFELLSGRRPSDLPSDIPAWRAELRGPLPSMKSAGTHVPRVLEAICRRALAENPVERYPDAHSLVVDLDAWLYRPPPRPRKVLGATFALGLVVGIGLARSAAPLAPDPRADDRSAHLSRERSGGDAGKRREPSIRILMTPPREPARSVFAIAGHRIYHRQTCLALRHNTPENTREFSGTAEARNQKLVPCQLCQPDDEGDPTPGLEVRPVDPAPDASR